ncbi:MAG: hypothetical protein PHC28_07845 [Flavobacterium sp.]|uniref:hypothetical protein n=1 Tax=Flavobacterium sp. TaxID=239 RepID=UPI0026177E69|nr:hypothetical protein [Flavobacterium sp.]MDD5150384.1 hypothetical protein [Flavobacterium sp.]
MTKIISGFPGIGKTSFFEENKKNYNILDSDSSNFKHNFPHDYIQNIISRIDENIWDFILVSSHKEVRTELEKYDIHYTLVYPEHTLKYEYIRRFINRGSSIQFIDKIHDNWDSYLNEIELEIFPDKIILSDNEYLSDWIPYLWFNK